MIFGPLALSKVIVMVTHSDGRPRGRQGQAEWQKADELTRRGASPGRVPLVRSRSRSARSRRDLRDAAFAANRRGGVRDDARYGHRVIKVTRRHAACRPACPDEGRLAGTVVRTDVL